MSIARIILAVATVVIAGSAHAADPTPDSAKAQFDAERSRCMSGTTGQTQDSCLRSAGAAYDASKQNRLRDPNTAFKENALARCQSLPEPDHTDCVSRVEGGGDQSGSVKGGGIIKETVTTVPAAK